MSGKSNLEQPPQPPPSLKGTISLKGLLKFDDLEHRGNFWNAFYRVFLLNINITMKPMWLVTQGTKPVVDSQEIWVQSLEVFLSEMSWQMHFGPIKDHNYIVVFPQNFCST